MLNWLYENCFRFNFIRLELLDWRQLKGWFCHVLWGWKWCASVGNLILLSCLSFACPLVLIWDDEKKDQVPWHPCRKGYLKQWISQVTRKIWLGSPYLSNFFRTTKSIIFISKWQLSNFWWHFEKLDCLIDILKWQI